MWFFLKILCLEGYMWDVRLELASVHLVGEETEENKRVDFLTFFEFS